MTGFYDLNVVVERENRDHMKILLETLHTVYMLGYDTVAVNTIVEADSGSQKGKKKGQAKAEKIPLPLNINVADVIKKEVRHRKFSVLQRLTVIINDASQTHQIQTSKVAKLYDILAVQPENEQSLRVCCSTLDADIITFSMDVKSCVFPTTKQIGLALERGIFFEINYSPALTTNAARRNTIFNGRRFVASCWKKNVIVSSQAKKAGDFRGPYDVINLCYLFDVNAAQALDAVSTCPRKVTLKAECRKSAKGVFTMTPASSFPAKDLWKIKNCRNVTAVEAVKIEDKEETTEDGLPKSKRFKKEPSG